jgi:hypothetical protein
VWRSSNGGQPSPARGSVGAARGGVGWCAMGSGSSKATTSSSSPTAAEAGGEVKRPNGSGKGRRGRSLLPLPSSSCFRGSTTPCEGDAAAAAVDFEVRAFPLGFVSLAVLRICARWNAVNRANEGCFHITNGMRICGTLERV